MDEPLFCPDCHQLHAEPAEASLGHLVRCLTCELSVAVAVAEAAGRTVPTVTSQVELRPAA